jgi:prepilin-type N-terminal cleavage/methylation domain-containing protein
MRKHKGFTLVELVVVVMILGILAAVAAPKLLGTSSAAADNGLKQTLAVVRDAIERYAAENAGQLPGNAGTADDLKLDLKEFLRGSFPICPVGSQDDTIKISTGATNDIAATTPTGDESWHYNKDNGQFICNCPDLTKSEDDPATLHYYEL